MFKKLIKSIDNLADAIDCLVEKLDAIFIESKQPLLTLGPGLYRETISGADPEVQKALAIQPAPRKQYRGTYTDEQSISSKLGRKVKRSELKDAATELGVAFIQDETNHHVYVKNTCLELVLNHLKNETEA